MLLQKTARLRVKLESKLWPGAGDGLTVKALD